jgi:hypothetical protein
MLWSKMGATAMANPEHVAMLKRGVEKWNQWRKDNPDIEIDLMGVSLSKLDLDKANLSRAHLNFANLSRAKLSGAQLINADLMRADLSRAHLDFADLSGADLMRAQLINTNLTDADLSGTRFGGAHLGGADLSRAQLKFADFSRTQLSGTIFDNSICSGTIFGNLDLSTAKGLAKVRHLSPSILGADTIFRSKGTISQTFLRGCGVPEALITALPSLLDETAQFYSCFISYSAADKEFAKRLHDRLQAAGIRCWLDEHPLHPGDKLHPTIFEAIRVYDKVILCCSETSLKSWWIDKEFEIMIDKEEDYHETLLIPLALDHYMFEKSADEWIIGEIHKKRLVHRFVNWKDRAIFDSSLEKLIEALRTDDGKSPPLPSKLTKRT